MAERWEPAGRDVLFLAGVDWRYLYGSGLETLANPRINLIQHVRHAHEGTELYRYLSERAVRICVSQEVADAISATGRTNGPVLTIPNGIDVTPFDSVGGGSPAGFDERRRPVTIVGYKSPELARTLSERLDAANIEHLLVCEFLDRSAFLALLGESRIAVCLPREREGFYLPVLEAMASGCLVVTLDCIGNRGFCHHEENCLIAKRDPVSLFETTKRALAMSIREPGRMHRRTRDTAGEHSLKVEMSRFHEILGDIDGLWAKGMTACRQSLSGSRAIGGVAVAEARDGMAQRSEGTTMLPEDDSGRRSGQPRVPAQSRTVWFYRDFRRLNGGFLKHSNYFESVRRMPGFVPRITFSREPANETQARIRERLWPSGGGTLAARWEPGHRDVLFLAGVDWSYVDELGLESLDIPRINLIQHVRHADEHRKAYRDLARRAIRICVSQEVTDAISATGQTNGPILTIPNGIDVAPFVSTGDGSPVGFDERRQPITIFGYKSPELARGLSERLHAAGIEHRLVSDFLDRSAFLELLGESRIAVCLPRDREGFYLPALEAMASGCLVVTLDCIGNRGFCHHEANCLVAGHTPDSLLGATMRALAMSGPERHRMHRRARDTAAEHSLEVERQRFQAILRDVDRLWSAAKAESTPLRPVVPALPVPYRPKLGFMIVGAQKCGTTALAHFLSQHPDIGMSSPKEVHLFDSPKYSNDWTPEQIDERYRPQFDHCTGTAIQGEATPIYMFLPGIARELKRYNPELKLIVLLHDPVERALSHYYMEKNRGKEPRPLWLALMREPFRLRRCKNARAYGSEMRVCSYRRRGLYSLQLRNLYRFFDWDRIMVVHTRDLRAQHHVVLRRVFAFLGVSEHVRIEPEIVFEGDRGGRRHRAVSWLLRLSYLAEFVRLRGLLRTHL